MLVEVEGLDVLRSGKKQGAAVVLTWPPGSACLVYSLALPLPTCVFLEKYLTFQGPIS